MEIESPQHIYPQSEETSATMYGGGRGGDSPISTMVANTFGMSVYRREKGESAGQLLIYIFRLLHQWPSTSPYRHWVKYTRRSCCPGGGRSRRRVGVFDIINFLTIPIYNTFRILLIKSPLWPYHSSLSTISTSFAWLLILQICRIPPPSLTSFSRWMASSDVFYAYDQEWTSLLCLNIPPRPSLSSPCVPMCVVCVCVLSASLRRILGSKASKSKQWTDM